MFAGLVVCRSISGLVVEYNVAIVVTRVRFPADACLLILAGQLPINN